MRSASRKSSSRLSSCERVARLRVEALVRHQEVAALEQLDRVAGAPREAAVDVLVDQPAFAAQLLLRGDEARCVRRAFERSAQRRRELVVRRACARAACRASARHALLRGDSLAIVLRVRRVEREDRFRIDRGVTRVARVVGEARAHDRERRHDAVELGERVLACLPCSSASSRYLSRIDRDRSPVGANSVGVQVSVRSTIVSPRAAPRSRRACPSRGPRPSRSPARSRLRS